MMEDIHTMIEDTLQTPKKGMLISIALSGIGLFVCTFLIASANRAKETNLVQAADTQTLAYQSSYSGGSVLGDSTTTCTYTIGTTSCSNTYYKDADGDGYGDVNTASVTACSAPSGYVGNSTDCDDANANAFPGQTKAFSTPRANGSYDYNCDGVDTKADTGCNVNLDTTRPATEFASGQSNWGVCSQPLAGSGVGAGCTYADAQTCNMIYKGKVTSWNTKPYPAGTPTDICMAPCGAGGWRNIANTLEAKMCTGQPCYVDCTQTCR